jgi:hypothetical protein
MPSLPWHFEDLGISDLHELSRGEGIRVAVLDTGVAYLETAFPELRSLKPSGAPTAHADPDGHGTACASLIASNDDEAPGIAPAVELIAIRVTVGRTPIETDVRRAFKTIMDNECHVVACSFTLAEAEDKTLDVIRAACNRGIVTVAAAGNDPHTPGAFPERTPNVIVAGAYDREREPVRSRTGLFTDFLAPGDALPVLTPDGSLSEFGQTSAAAAVTAGVMALMLSFARSKNPSCVGLALEGLARASACEASGKHYLDPGRLLAAVRSLPALR